MFFFFQTYLAMCPISVFTVKHPGRTDKTGVKKSQTKKTPRKVERVPSSCFDCAAETSVKEKRCFLVL